LSASEEKREHCDQNHAAERESKADPDGTTPWPHLAASQHLHAFFVLRTGIAHSGDGTGVAIVGARNCRSAAMMMW
jgi:hypothetical protein